MIRRTRAPRNRTLTIDQQERRLLSSRLKSCDDVSSANFLDTTIVGDCLAVAKKLPIGFADLMILDPPYNIDKNFGETTFAKQPTKQYTAWLSNVLSCLVPIVKPTGSVYICGDWHTSVSIFEAASKLLEIRNRITWEREKGRGAKTNWKNASEDIWFCTRSDRYTFNVEAVKVRRRVIAPYRTEDGSPKDWSESPDGNFRDTHPSNLWTDITIPFWSMPENTDHPTQKSEKLVAKLILASSNPADVIFDPFLGSGTTSVVAKKLGRRFIGIEAVEEYALLAEKRLSLTASHQGIQGYADRVFWERNSLRVAHRQVSREPKIAPNAIGHLI